MDPTFTRTENASVSEVTVEPVPESDGMGEMLTTAQTMHWYSSVIFGTIFVVVGLVGNSFSISIWGRKKMRSSTGTYLIAQAVADSGLLAFFFVTDSLVMICPSIKSLYAFGVFYSYIGYPIFFLFVILSIWITVGVTVDRYIQVCWISQSKAMCNYKKALTGIGIISLLCFIINTPHFNTYYPVHPNDRKSSESAYAYTEFGKGKGSQNYEFWVHCMILVLVPWVTIFTLNMLIIRKLQVNRQKLEKHRETTKTKSHNRENQITRILLTVTFTFLVLIALQCITQCFFMLKPKTVNFELVDEAFAVAKLGIVINSSINFFLYCLTGRQFRKEFAKQIGCMCVCRKGLLESTDSTSSSGFETSETGQTRF